MLWIALVLSTTIVAAGHSIVDKQLMSQRQIAPVVGAMSFGIVGLPVALIGLLILPAPHAATAVIGIISGTLFVLAAWLYYHAVAREDISWITPLLRLSTVQMFLVELLIFNTMFSNRQWGAFILFVLSSLILSVPRGDRGKSVYSILIYILPATTLLAANGLLTAHIYRTESLWVGVVWENMGMVIGMILLCLITWHKRITPFERLDQRTWLTLLLQQITRLVTGLAPAWAIEHGVSTSLVTALGGARLAWIWVLAIIFLHERVRRADIVIRGIAILGMIVGTWLLT